MELTRITDSNSEEFKAAYAIYQKSFPLFEQRILADQIEALSDAEYFAQVAKDEQGQVVALLFTWQTGTFIYIEHLAVSENARGKNIGTKLLTQLKENASVPIILEIDPPIDAISIRRRGFYERLGFIMSDFERIHPKFRADAIAYELKVLSSPSIDEKLYKEFNDYFENRIAYYSFSRKNK